MTRPRIAYDESEHSRVAKPSASFAEPSFFDSPPPAEPPTAAGEAVTPDHRLTEELLVLERLTLVPRGEFASRARIAALTGIARETLCWRLDALTKEGYVELGEKCAQSHRKASLKVNGYRISPSGRERLGRAA